MTTDTEKYLTLLDVVRDASIGTVPGGCWCFRVEGPHSAQCKQVKEFMEAYGWQDMEDSEEPANEIADRVRKDYETGAGQEWQSPPTCPECGVKVTNLGDHCSEHEAAQQYKDAGARMDAGHVETDPPPAIEEDLAEAFQDVKKDYRHLESRLQDVTVLTDDVVERLDGLVSRIKSLEAMFKDLVVRVEGLERWHSALEVGAKNRISPDMCSYCGVESVGTRCGLTACPGISAGGTTDG